MSDHPETRSENWFDGSSAFPAELPGPVVTIGNFDGVHRGHRTLVDRAIALAGQLGTGACAYTFHPAPRDVLRPDNPVQRIQILSDRVHTLLDEGLDHVVVEPFTLELARFTPERFAEEILAGRLRAAAVVVGHDFRFGKGRAGGVPELRQALSVPVEQLAALTDDAGPISSSRVRQALLSGNLPVANALLGRSHSLVGTVVHGDHRGRAIGFPTANMVHEGGIVPAYGVYAVRVRVGETWHDGVANVGVRPMYGPTQALVEAHLFDFDDDLYGQRIRVAFVERLREERRFDSVEALVAQIRADAEAARRLL